MRTLNLACLVLVALASAAQPAFATPQCTALKYELQNKRQTLKSMNCKRPANAGACKAAREDLHRFIDRTRKILKACKIAESD
jgi:hypothetical protein